MNEATRSLHTRAGTAYGQEATCGKKIDYRSEGSAVRAAAAMSLKAQRAMEAYPCAWCTGWHIGRAMTPTKSPSSVRKKLMDTEDTTVPGETLLSGVVGSTAYGLAVAGSDVDYLSLFARPTRDLLGLVYPAESITTHEPDHTQHEAAKYLRLALKCNPTAIELLWLPAYIAATQLGLDLVMLRSDLLSAKLVRDAYMGYAAAQFRRLEARGGDSFDSDIPPRRVAKHARHLKRLCHQGYTLLATGELPIKLENPDAFLDFGDEVASPGGVEAARRLMAEYEEKYDALKPVIREVPDHQAANAWLLRVRRHYYVNGEPTWAPLTTQ